MPVFSLRYDIETPRRNHNICAPAIAKSSQLALHTAIDPLYTLQLLGVSSAACVL